MYKNEPVKKLADSHGPVIIQYKVVNIRFITLNGIITGLLSAYYSCARCKSYMKHPPGAKVCKM